MCISSLILQLLLPRNTTLYNSLLVFKKNICLACKHISISQKNVLLCWLTFEGVFLPWSPQGGCQWPSALPQAVTGLVGFLTGTGHGGQGLLDLRQIGTYKTKNNGNTGLCQIRCPTIFKYASTNKPAIVTCVKYKFLT